MCRRRSCVSNEKHNKRSVGVNKLLYSLIVNGLLLSLAATLNQSFPAAIRLGSHLAHCCLCNTGLQPSQPGSMNYSQYEDCWTRVTRGAQDIHYGDIPWPPADNPLLLLRSDSLEVQKQKLKSALLRWHPDKFVGSCGKRLVDNERERILDAVKLIAHRVIEWKGKLMAAA